MKEIFVSVMDRSAEERQLALAEACQDDLELQAELREFLAQYDEVGAFLNGVPPASASSLLASGYLVADRYEVVTLLGTGGMGEVYEVLDKELGVRVALKVIHPEMTFNHATLDRFRREVQLARQVTHSNVCRVFDIGRDRQQAREIIFLTMELIQGETLAARLKRLGTIEPHEALSIAIQLCHALGAAHQAGILHRDFKCSNAMLIGSGEKVRAVVTDFGIARWVQDSTDSTALTIKGAIFGTPAYMSPEQIQGKELTTASDIYSLGVVLYEMVTGVRPFQDEHSGAEAVKRLAEDPIPPRKLAPGLTPNWNDTILACLQRDPARRFTSTEQILASLQQSKKLAPLSQFRKLVFAAAALLVLAGVAITIAFRVRFFLPRLPADKRVAVLPFSLASNDPAERAEADGLAESLTANLAHLENSNSSLWVVPWKSVRERPRSDERHAAGALGANLLVTGQFEKAGSQLLLLVEVKDATDLKELRSQIINVPKDRIAGLEAELLEKVSDMVQIRVPKGMLRHLPVDETSEPDAQALYIRGRGYLLQYDTGSVQHAIDLFKKALEKDPKFALAHADLAFAYAWKYRDTKNAAWLEGAKLACEQALSLNPNLSTGHLTSGMIQEDTGNLQRAIDEYEAASKLDPDNDEVSERLALAYDKTGRVLRAERLLQGTLRRNPANWVAYDYVGIFYYNHSDYKQAEQAFNSAIELAPDNPMAFYNLGGVYLRQERYKEAEDILRRGIAIQPTAAAYSNLGSLLLEKGGYVESAANLQKATELAPDNNDYWFNLGNAYAYTKEWDRSRHAYKQATQAAEKNLSIKPNDGNLLESLALYYAVSGDKTSALRKLAQVPTPFASQPSTLYQSAEVYEIIGQRDQALKALRAAILAGLSLDEIENTPMFGQLRADPRYRQMIAP